MEKHLSREIIESFGFKLYEENLTNIDFPHDLWFKLNDIDLCWYPDTDHVTIDTRVEWRVWSGRLNIKEELEFVLNKTDLDLRIKSDAQIKAEKEQQYKIWENKIELVSRERMSEIIDAYQPLGLFYTIEKGIYISCYNLDGNATVEEHQTKNDMLDWIFDYDNVSEERKEGLIK